MRNLRQLLRRSGWLSAESSRSRGSEARRSSQSRRLKAESLEKRQLLAGDIALAHNYLNSNDVDQNRAITAADALAVINYLNVHGSGREITEGMDVPSMVDVNADHRVTAADALAVINALNLGEGVGEVVELFLDPRNANDTLLTASATSTPQARDFTVNVGDIFFLELSYADFRQSPNDLGAFQISTDISLSQTGVLQPVLTELQTLTFDPAFNQPGQTGTFQFEIPGQIPGQTSPFPPVTINRDDFFQEPVFTLSQALENKTVPGPLGVVQGYRFDQFRVTNLTRTVAEGQPRPEPILQISFIDLNLGGINLPNPVITGTTDPVTVRTAAPFNPDGSINGAALPGSFDTRSRTFTDVSGNTNGEFYNQRRFGSFDDTVTADAFNEVGVLGRINANGVRGESQFGRLVEPFDAFSIPVRFTQPVSNFQISLNTAEDTEAVLLYPGGAGTTLTPDQVLINSASGSFTITAVGSTTLPTVSVAVSPASVLEDGATNLVYTFTRTGATTQPLTINYATGGTATANSDFTGTSTSVIIPAGATTATVTVDPTADTLVEGDETVSLTISPNSGVYLVSGTAATATGTITDDDGAAVPTISVAVSPASVLEDGAANLVYTFTRTGATTSALTVNYAAGGTATTGTDYTGTGTSVVIPAGSATATVTVDPTADTVVEGDETVVLTISPNASVYNVSGTAGSATGTITDDDSVGLPTISVAVSPTSVLEDGAANLVYTFTRTGATTSALTVNYTATGTATTGTDYTGTGTSIVIPAGAASATVTVDPTADTTVEPDETVVLTITANSTVYNVSGTAGSATGTITNDDAALPAISVSVSPTSVVENGTTNLVYTFARTGATTSALTVNYTVSGTATAGTDYTGTSTSVVIPAGAASATVTVDPTPDTIAEGSETVVLTITPNASVYSVGTASATGTITDPVVVNQPPVVSGPVTRTVTEDDAATTVNLLANATDPNAGDVLAVANVVVVAGDDNRGIVVSGNNLSVTPSAYSFLTGGQAVVRYTYNVIDGKGGSTPATATVTITGINDAPVANNDPNLVAFSGTTTRLNVLANDNAGGGENQAITVISATITSGNATVAPTADGSAVSLTAPAGVTGTVVFNYTIRDAGGLTASATATVNVQDFIPSTIGGSLFFDNISNLDAYLNGATAVRNGLQDAGDAGLGGMPIVLTSGATQNVTGQAISRTVFTELSGKYSFTNLPPGTYTVTYAIPATVVYGRDILGSAGSDGTPNGQMTVTIAQPGGPTSSKSDINFTLYGTRSTGEAGSGLEYLDLLTTNYLAANSDIVSMSNGGRQGGVVALAANGTQLSFSAADGFSGVKFGEFTLNASRDAALLTIIGQDNVARTANLDRRHFVVSQDGKSVRFFGGQEDFNFVAASQVESQDFANFRNLVDQIMATV